MTYYAVNSNPIPQLVELSTDVEQSTTEGTLSELYTTLMFQPDEIDVGDFTVSVQIVEATLIVTTDGQRIDPTTKLGMRDSSQRVSSTAELEKSLITSVSKSVALQSAAEGNFSALDASFKSAGQASRQRDEKVETTLSEKRASSVEHIPVEAVGADRWKVSQQNGQPLRGYYLTRTRLCDLIKASERPNQLGVKAAIKVRPRHINIEVERDRRRVFKTKNKERLLGVLITNRLSELTRAEDEALTVAVSESFPGNE